MEIVFDWSKSGMYQCSYSSIIK